MRARAVASRHALDEPRESEASQVVGHGAGPIRGRIAALQLRNVIAQLPMAKAGGREPEPTARVHERMHTIAKWPYEGFEFTSFGTARYPGIAHNANLTGVVVLALIADDQGRIDPRPLTDLTLFTEAAVAHARQWRVRPTSTKRRIMVYQFALDNYDCTSEYNSVFWTVMPGFVRLSGCQPWIK